MNSDSPSAPPSYDLVVIGGGINGAGIAADAAGRGLSVLLCERDDLASHTSSASSKLIHGGLRYLEYFEFRLVREALAEREVLLKIAPHIVRPLRFILPHRPQLRSAWLIRAGLFLYDHLGHREHLPGTERLRFGADSPLKPTIKRGFAYSDCWVDDARLVVLNAISAREHGARIETRTQCTGARRHGNEWLIELARDSGERFSVRARALVNATGPWVADFIEQQLVLSPAYQVRLVQGSHVVVPKLYQGDHAYIMQNSDRRIVFAIPYLERYTLIGTTDRDYAGDPAQVRISAEEIDYLLGVTNDHFQRQLQPADVVHAFAGVRSLRDDEADNPTAVTRDYTLTLAGTAAEAPLLSVFGGKLTTYRKLAEAALAELAPWFPTLGRAWTADAPLPGGEGLVSDGPGGSAASSDTLDSTAELAATLMQRVAGITPALARRWATTYGSRSLAMLGDARSVEALGEPFGAGLHAREVDYLCREEWARDCEDILWRRTKLGLALSPRQQARLGDYLAERRDEPPACAATTASAGERDPALTTTKGKIA